MTAVEHIGSTAVPGLVGKPIPDLAARAAPGVDPFGLLNAERAARGLPPTTAWDK